MKVTKSGLERFLHESVHISGSKQSLLDKVSNVFRAFIRSFVQMRDFFPEIALIKSLSLRKVDIQRPPDSPVFSPIPRLPNLAEPSLFFPIDERDFNASDSDEEIPHPSVKLNGQLEFSFNELFGE